MEDDLITIHLDLPDEISGFAHLQSKGCDECEPTPRLKISIENHEFVYTIPKGEQLN